ncbi:Hypothetical predicted protein [Pelobates cultripes]|uniref:Uncharacterized protein n=1 Tax=Pelobates cultripes TaxID=61616 RepID=A0AAD1RHP1_PELCU|nr:Hypothetical predicted protein [Pelobates cultripes]
MDLKKYIQSLTIKRHFLLHPSSPALPDSEGKTAIHQKFQPTSQFFPINSRGPFLETFEHMVDREFQSLTKKKNRPGTYNLTKKEESILKNLMERTDLVIREADKGTHIRLPNPPGHPIISGINSITANLSEFVDASLQKYAQGAPSYLKDTKSFLQELECMSGILSTAGPHWMWPHCTR